jgi:hypothetical protein
VGYTVNSYVYYDPVYQEVLMTSERILGTKKQEEERREE